MGDTWRDRLRASSPLQNGRVLTGSKSWFFGRASRTVWWCGGGVVLPPGSPAQCAVIWNLPPPCTVLPTYNPCHTNCATFQLMPVCVLAFRPRGRNRWLWSCHHHRGRPLPGEDKTQVITPTTNIQIGRMPIQYPVQTTISHLHAEQLTLIRLSFYICFLPFFQRCLCLRLYSRHTHVENEAAPAWVTAEDETRPAAAARDCRLEEQFSLLNGYGLSSPHWYILVPGGAKVSRLGDCTHLLQIYIFPFFLLFCEWGKSASQKKD